MSEMAFRSKDEQERHQLYAEIAALRALVRAQVQHESENAAQMENERNKALAQVEALEQSLGHDSAKGVACFCAKCWQGRATAAFGEVEDLKRERDDWKRKAYAEAKGNACSFAERAERAEKQLADAKQVIAERYKAHRADVEMLQARLAKVGPVLKLALTGKVTGGRK